MAAYYFRFLDEDDGKPNGWIGFVYAPSRYSLFWTIDEHGDPYQCEIKTAHRASYCVSYDASEGDDWELEAHEIGGSVYDAIHATKGWRRATWDDIYPPLSNSAREVLLACLEGAPK